MALFSTYVESKLILKIDLYFGFERVSIVIEI